MASGGLVLAAMRGSVDEVRQHLASNWVRAQGCTGKHLDRTALEAAAERGHTAVVELLLEHDKGTATHLAQQLAEHHGRTELAELIGAALEGHYAIAKAPPVEPKH